MSLKGSLMPMGRPHEKHYCEEISFHSPAAEAHHGHRSQKAMSALSSFLKQRYFMLHFIFNRLALPPFFDVYHIIHFHDPYNPLFKRALNLPAMQVSHFGEMGTVLNHNFRSGRENIFVFLLSDRAYRTWPRGQDNVLLLSNRTRHFHQ